jgi:superfamily II DNA or RNA helicase
MTDKVAISYAGEIKVSRGDPPFPLYEHQEDAIKKLDDKVLHSKAAHFAGLLVIPTGGGKTLVAVRWLLENVVGRNKKVLWIAHRHQLLEQAFVTVTDNAYSSLLPARR